MIPASALFDQPTIAALLDHDPLILDYRAFFSLLDWSVIEQWEAKQVMLQEKSSSGKVREKDEFRMDDASCEHSQFFDLNARHMAFPAHFASNIQVNSHFTQG